MQSMASNHPFYWGTFKCLRNASDGAALSLTSLQLLRLILLRNLNLNLNPEARFMKDYMRAVKAVGHDWLWVMFKLKQTLGYQKGSNNNTYEHSDKWLPGFQARQHDNPVISCPFMLRILASAVIHSFVKENVEDLSGCCIFRPGFFSCMYIT